MTPSPTTSFTVANIHPGSVRTEFMLSVMALVEKERAFTHTLDPAIPRVRFDKFFSHHSGPYLDDARNNCAIWFLDQTESDYLLFIDSDVEFDPNQPYQLVEAAHEHGATILTGVYYNSFHNFGGLCALVHRWGHNEIYDCQDLIPLHADELASLTPWDKPHQVDACGAGFLAIHRSCLEDMRSKYDMPQPIFAELNIGGIHMGEDLSFCVRATALGHAAHVLPSIEVAHYKTCAIRRQPSPSQEFQCPEK